MSERITSKRIVATALALGLGVSGCAAVQKHNSNTIAPETANSVPQSPKKIACKPERPDLWVSPTQIESKLNLEAVARPLKVNTAAVEAGKYGGAICEQAIDPESVANQTALVTIEGIGNICVAIGLGNPQAPDETILAICAKE